MLMHHILIASAAFFMSGGVDGLSSGVVDWTDTGKSSILTREPGTLTRM